MTLELIWNESILITFLFKSGQDRHLFGFDHAKACAIYDMIALLLCTHTQ